MFSIFTYSEYRKLGFQKIRDFQTSVFSIFTIGEYRKHGCLKTSDFLNLSFRYSLDRCLKYEIFKHPCFRYSLQVNIENTDVGNLRFLKSQF